LVQIQQMVPPISIEATASANGYTANLLEGDRAKRPIIEFDSGLALYNHGLVAKTSVALIDDKTTDVFSTIVNATGYIVDGVALAMVCEYYSQQTQTHWLKIKFTQLTLSQWDHHL
jgi:hypothetical protein